MSIATQGSDKCRTVRALINTSNGLHSITAGDWNEKRTVHIVLQDSADRLTSRELIRITRVAEQAHAAVHISCSSWQVLLDIPEASRRSVTDRLRAMGYGYDALSGEIDEGSTFALREGAIGMKPNVKTTR